MCACMDSSAREILVKRLAEPGCEVDMAKFHWRIAAMKHEDDLCFDFVAHLREGEKKRTVLTDDDLEKVFHSFFL